MFMRNLTIYEYIDAIARSGSIRQAAEILAITPSALNRRVLALEEELGLQIFERLGRGVRLNTAGEILIDHFRRHIAETNRVKSQLADLSGLRSGKILIACSQALLPFFLPAQIKKYQAQHPEIQFSVQVRDGLAAANALLDYSADLALVFEPLDSWDFQTIVTITEPIHAVFAADHPLAKSKELRLSDCLNYPLALPSRPYAVRNLLDEAASRMSSQLEPTVEAESYVFLRNYTLFSQAITFELKIGVPPDNMLPALTSVPINLGREFRGSLHLAQLRGRILPIASSKFVEQLSTEFEQNYTTT